MSIDANSSGADAVGDHEGCLCWQGCVSTRLLLVRREAQHS